MNRCRTCKHWQHQSGGGGAYCTSGKMVEDRGRVYTADMLVYEYNGSAE